MLDGNPKLVLSLIGKLKTEKDPLNLIKCLEGSCEKACGSTSNKNITSKQIPLIEKRLMNMCNKLKMNGGSAATIEWNGKIDSSYSTTASTADVLNVNLDGIARPAINPALADSLNQSGGGKRNESISMLTKQIGLHCKKHDKTLDKSVKEFLAKHLLKNMRCLVRESMKKNRLLKMR